MKNYKLTLSYDGTSYHGWQIQPNAVTIQELLQDALRKITGEDIKVTGSSRTDAGVHARKYVCNFKSDTTISTERMPHAINSCLPDDVRVSDCEIVPDDFNARFSTKQKTYLYRINTSKIPDVFNIKYSWHVTFDLDFDKMCIESKKLVGTHDFVSFMASGSDVINTERTVTDLKLSREGDFINMYITADGYLYNMVRIIAGTLVCVGMGKIDDISEVISAKDRAKAGKTAPAQGLFLYDIEY